jgi:Ni/Co efflux regulator RcnB
MHRIKSLLIFLLLACFSAGTIAAQQHKPVKHTTHHATSKRRTAHRKTAHRGHTTHRAPASHKAHPKAN